MKLITLLTVALLLTFSTAGRIYYSGGAGGEGNNCVPRDNAWVCMKDRVQYNDKALCELNCI